MKGTVFIALNDMIESQYGIDVWEELLDTVKPEGLGIYTSTEDYLDSDINAFVVAISKKLNLETTVVTCVFGDYLFGELNKKYSIFTTLCSNLFDFLQSIENVIHKEVRKLYNNPSLPSLNCQIINEKELVMRYQSSRKLCYLAEGLILGASNHYQQPVKIIHEKCMHDGEDHCILKVIAI